MIQCPKCNTSFDEKGKWGIKKFCSRSCANSRLVSNETKIKTSNTLKTKVTRRPQTTEEILRRNEKIKETRLNKYNNTLFNDLGSENRRRRVFEEQDHRCIKCNIAEWFGKPISLELDHKDGNTLNNSRENLEGLCPNCHSVTDTWRGRNKPAKNGLADITDEYLLQCLKDADNIRQGLLKAGLAAKGNNYARAKKLLELI